MTTFYYMNPKSQNRKTGKMPVSTSGAGTCPPSCPFIGHGCYAEGYPLKGRWDEVTTGKRGGTFAQFIGSITALATGTLWRHNQAGDLPGENDKLDKASTLAIAGANEGKRGFTFSHYPVVDHKHAKHNRAVIATANARGFTVNLSANNLDHADKLAELGIGPVAVVLPADFEGKTTKTPSGRTVSRCPATYLDTTCADCQLCQRQTRAAIVGFPAHGISKRKATEVAS
jgi:hypothetical protein